MSDSQSRVPALVKALAVQQQLVRKAYRKVAFQHGQVEAAYNAIEADRLNTLAGEKPTTTIGTHTRRVKEAEAILCNILGIKAEMPKELLEMHRDMKNIREHLHDLWNATVQLRNAITAETPDGAEPARSYRSIDNGL